VRVSGAFNHAALKTWLVSSLHFHEKFKATAQRKHVAGAVWRQHLAASTLYFHKSGPLSNSIACHRGVQVCNNSFVIPTNNPHRIPVPLVALPTPLATPPLAPLAVPDIPPLGSPLALPPLVPPLPGAGTLDPLPPLPAGVRADGTLLYLLGGLDVVGGCSTKVVSEVRKVASTSGGAVCEAILCIAGEAEDMVRARAKDCGVGACGSGC